jgi:hypothetical protein
MNPKILRQIAVVISVAATITLNILANALPLNGLNTGEISDRFAIYFVPAGYVFSIWGLIYLGLIAYAVFQALPSQRENPRLMAISGWFMISCAANVVWLFLWHYERFAFTLPAMIIILICLIVVYLRLDMGKKQGSTAEKWCARIPFSIYLGWITVATIANTTQYLYYIRWNGWGISPEAWAVIMLAVATLVAGMVSYTRRDVAYSLVLVWAFVGIALKHSETILVSGAAWATAALVVVFLILFAILKLPRIQPATGV